MKQEIIDMYKHLVTVLNGNRALRTRSKEFSDFGSWSDDEKKCIKDLQDTFNVLEGYGLAAPQIGVFKQAVIINFRALGVEDESLGSAELIVNPKIETFGESQVNEEACFSVPHVSAKVKRPMSCRVEYTSGTGGSKTIELSGFPAACLQHELDHLAGKLYLDRIGSISRSMKMKKILKIESKINAEKKALKEDFEREHREISQGVSTKKTTHSKKRKPKRRKKRVKQSKKR